MAAVDPARCSPTDPSWMCISRQIATRSGDMAWNPRHANGQGGYVYPIAISSYAYAQSLPRFAWTFCPFCGETLPPFASVNPDGRPELPPAPPPGDATAWDGIDGEDGG